MEGASQEGGEAAVLVDEGFEQKLMERYLKSCLSILPRPYESQDSVRTTILYFVTSSLDVLGFLDSPAAEARGLMPPDLRATVIEWLYAMHIPRPTRTLPISFQFIQPFTLLQSNVLFDLCRFII
jgi:hypothetical protein